MSNSPLDKIIGEKRYVLDMDGYKAKAIEQTTTLLSNSINSVSVDLAQRLIKHGIAPTKVVMTYPYLEKNEVGIFRKRLSQQLSTRSLSYNGWLVYHDPSAYADGFDYDGSYMVLCSNGAPFTFSYSNLGKGITRKSSGAEEIASSYLSSYYDVSAKRFYNETEINKYFEQYRQTSLDQYIQSLSPLIDRLI